MELMLQNLYGFKWYKKALVIGAETLSKSIDWNDRSTCVLFGDGAGAVVLSLSENEGILDVICKSKGIKWEKSHYWR